MTRRVPPSRRDGGYALLLVMIAIAITVVVSMGVLTSLRPATVMADNSRHGAEALAVAEGGLDAVEAFITDTSHAWSSDPSPKSEGWWLTDTTLGGGTYSVHAERTDGDDADGSESFADPGRVRLTGYGTVDGVTAISTRVVTPNQDDSLRVLFVLDDQTEPTPGSDEETKRDLMLSWGFTVNYISSTENQTVFDAAELVNDVAYITEDVLGSHVNTKLKAFGIGVVSEEAVLNDDFGFSSTAYAYNTTTIDITDNTHYITNHLSLGNHTIADSSQQMVYAYGTYGAGMRVLAERPSTSYPQLFVFDAGDALYGGGNAAGRRVMLPWGNSSSSFTFQEINANGHEIMKRAIEWAASPTYAPRSMDLLFVVRDDTLNAQEQIYVDLFESWGWTVTTLKDDTDASTLATAAEANDAVFVTNVSNSTLNTKLQNVTVGVVMEEVPLYDEFGFSSTESRLTDDEIDITDDTHPITEDFGTGRLTILTSGQSLSYLDGTISSGFRTLAENDGGSFRLLGVLDQGDARHDSGTSPGRRVKLPWGPSGFDYAAMNSDAEDLLRAAIEWAATIP